ncbi:hypothetical protein PLICRDRAFT_175126 [Plicaturopsis crispa FD-325 SS-3]|nr:hypothetical protein PLICRDRAFT_175126 [Plicaturopsis crispa FD-325 SS-3]
MAPRRSRKRRRSEAFAQEEEEQTPAPEENQSSNADHKEGDTGDNEETAKENSEKEREIWDAFREEHFEGELSLPLSLHRQLILMRELDDQAQAHNSDLLPSIQQYIALRRSLVSYLDGAVALGSSTEVPDVPMNEAKDDSGSKTPEPTAHLMSISPQRPPVGVNHTEPTQTVGGSTSKSSSIPPGQTKPPKTTRELLSHIAWLSEEVLRASEEKVNLAQAACDSIDRHIRLLDQSISEQETSLSLGIRPGTQPAPIVLPELVVPRWVRAAHAERSPTPSFGVDDASGNVGPENPSEVVPDDTGNVSSGPGRRRKGVARRGKDKKTDNEAAPTATGGGRRTVKSVKLSLPTEEERPYCYCHQPSYGEMVACDDADCEREWFHLGCVGLTEPPAEDVKWYCHDCLPHNKGSRRRRKR